ncbi:MAG: choice-of-anchor tandem repeat GloVer-containing protein [Terriglobales bacterium]
MKKLMISKSRRLLAAVLAVCILNTLTQAQLQPDKASSYKEKVLYAFTGESDGWLPSQVLVRDARGNLYGSTAFGGNYSGLCTSEIYDGCGVVFKVSAAGTFSVLHTFDFNDGADPAIGAQDADGNLYGTAFWGGKRACQDGGCGLIFKLTPAGEFTVLYSFTGGSDGANPYSLIMDDQGDLYGTTSGTNTGVEEIFELTNSGSLEVLHVFGQSPDGNLPEGIIRDSAGNLYGTTAGGGTYGAGTVFKVDTTGNEAVLYSFKGKSDGGLPFAPPIMDNAGNLYGTASQDGDEKGACNPPDSTLGCGTVFKVDAAGVFSKLFAFHYVNGDYAGPLSLGTHGAIYGTTAFGGNGCSQGGCGVAFKVNSEGKESVLYNFQGQAGGSWPGKLVEDRKGNQYGTAVSGGDLSCPYQSGTGCGMVFELIP